MRQSITEFLELERNLQERKRDPCLPGAALNHRLVHAAIVLSRLASMPNLDTSINFYLQVVTKETLRENRER